MSYVAHSCKHSHSGTLTKKNLPKSLHPIFFPASSPHHHQSPTKLRTLPNTFLCQRRTFAIWQALLIPTLSQAYARCRT